MPRHPLNALLRLIAITYREKFYVRIINHLKFINYSKLIYFSTDAVFDGKKSGKYLESDTPNPLSYYGKTKLEAEKIILKNTDNLILGGGVGYESNIWLNGMIGSIGTKLLLLVCLIVIWFPAIKVNLTFLKDFIMKLKPTPKEKEKTEEEKEVENIINIPPEIKVVEVDTPSKMEKTIDETNYGQSSSFRTYSNHRRKTL